MPAPSPHRERWKDRHRLIVEAFIHHSNYTEKNQRVQACSYARYHIDLKENSHYTEQQETVASELD